MQRRLYHHAAYPRSSGVYPRRFSTALVRVSKRGGGAFRALCRCSASGGGSLRPGSLRVWLLRWPVTLEKEKLLQTPPPKELEHSLHCKRKAQVPPKIRLAYAVSDIYHYR
jgi:hypothetical protein